MEAKQVYKQLERDFIKPGFKDDWPEISEKMKKYVTPQFIERDMGLLCDFTDKVEKVYTAVFPEDRIMEKIIKDNVKNAMLFLHHPLKWDSRENEVFLDIKEEYLKEFKKRKISIFVFHVPLDDFSSYSTSYTLASKLGLKVLTTFHKYGTSSSGLICSHGLTSIAQLKERFEKILGHDSKLYPYGDKDIKGKKIAIIAGGGNTLKSIKELIHEEAGILLTGVTRITKSHKPTIVAHEFAKKKKITLIGGTHYSTEKFACIKMCDYFKEMGLDSEFISNKPVMEDM